MSEDNPPNNLDQNESSGRTDQPDARPEQPKPNRRLGAGGLTFMQRLVIGTIVASIVLIAAGAFAFGSILNREQALEARAYITVGPPQTRTPTRPPATYTPTPTYPVVTYTPNPSNNVVKQGDLAVTLKFVEVDAAHIAVKILVSGLENHPRLSAAAWLLEGPNKVFTVEGLNSEPSFAEEPGMVYTANFSPSVVSYDSSGKTELINNYLSWVNGEIDLKLVVWIVDNPLDNAGLLDSLNAKTPGPNSIGPFEFKISAKVDPEKVIAVHQTQTMNGQTVTLQQVTVTRSRTVALLCYSLPGPQDWQADARLEWNGNNGQFISWTEVDMPTGQGHQRCVDYQWDIRWIEEKVHVTIIVDRLRAGDPEPGVQKPEIQGPWVFEVSAP